jgi:hypothetical protein
MTTIYNSYGDKREERSFVMGHRHCVSLVIEGGTGDCHEVHLNRFEQDGLLIPFGSNGEREWATRNR